MSRKASLTFGSVFSLYSNYAKSRLRSYGEIVGLKTRYLRHLEARRLSSITRLELQQLHSEIGATAGHTAANRALELISTVYNRALLWQLYSGTNPAQGIDKYRLRSRDRFLKPNELAPLLAAVDSCKSATVRDFLYMCLYTAARSGNVMAMRWTEIDWEQALWLIPQTKNGDPQYVPLHPEALKILRARHGIAPRSQYVFPGKHGGHMTNPRKTWYDILQRAGLHDLRIHDLRRTHATWQLRGGVHLQVIGKTLNHRDLRSTLDYARVDHEPVREAMHIAITAMLEARASASI